MISSLDFYALDISILLLLLLTTSYNQSKQAYSTVQRLRLIGNWLVTGLFFSTRAAQIQQTIILKKFGVPKYVPQCNWHGAQAHTWAVDYL
jgi:hypothetical protein